jgi:hypothetical protein
MIALDMMQMDKQGVHSDCPCDCDIVYNGLGCEGIQEYASFCAID